MLFRRLLLALLALGLVYYVGRAVQRALASDEQKIWWTLESMAEGFEDTRLGKVIRGLSVDFEDESSGFTREEVKPVLMHLFFTEKHPETKAFPLYVDLRRERATLTIEDGDPKTAVLDLEPLFLDRREGAGAWWDASLRAELEKGVDGWQIVRTSRVNHSDRNDGR